MLASRQYFNTLCLESSCQQVSRSLSAPEWKILCKVDFYVLFFRVFVSVITLLLTGFCGETKCLNDEILDLLDKAKFDSRFLFKYSERSKTHAASERWCSLVNKRVFTLKNHLPSYRKGFLEETLDLGRNHVVCSTFLAAYLSHAQLVFVCTSPQEVICEYSVLINLSFCFKAACNHTVELGG